MIGQELILNKLKSFTINTLPKSILLVGPSGAGKHTITSEVGKYYGLDVIELSGADFDFNLIDEYQQDVLDKIYLINLDTFSLKLQNKFLKFIEEPALHVFIIAIANSETNILPTISNRCLKYKLAEYTEEQLRQIKVVKNDILYKLCNTPGQLLTIDEPQITPLMNLCNSIILKFDTIDKLSLLKISNYINCAEDYNKFDFNLFFNALLFQAKQEYIKNSNQTAYKIYTFTARFLQKLLYNNTLSKENILLNYFSELK